MHLLYAATSLRHRWSPSTSPRPDTARPQIQASAGFHQVLIAPTHGGIARLSRPRWLVLYKDGLPTLWQLPILVLTQPSIEQLHWSIPMHLSLSETAERCKVCLMSEWLCNAVVYSIHGWHRCSSDKYLMMCVNYGKEWGNVLCCRKQDEEETRQKFTEVNTNADGLLTWQEYAGSVFGYNEDELLKFAQDTDPAMQTFNRVSIMHCHTGF